VALGQSAERFLVRDLEQLEQALRARERPFSGRVSFIPARPPEGTPTAPVGEPPTHPGIIAVAERVVRCEDPELVDLPARLLGRTLIVRDLACAREIAAGTPGWRFVTLQGELLEADGTLTVGTHHAEAGILSRKSELRELREQLEVLDRGLAELDQDVQRLRDQIAERDGQVETQEVEVGVLNEQLTELRSRIGQHRQRREGLHEEAELSRTEMTNLEQEIEKLHQEWQSALARATEADDLVQSIHLRMQAADQEAREREAQRQELQQIAMKARVELAQVQERLTALRARYTQTAADLEQREQERRQQQTHLQGMRARLLDNQQALLEAFASQAEGCHRKEKAELALAADNRQREGLRQRRAELSEQAQATRSEWRTQQEEAHTRELEVNNLRHRLQDLCARLQEDYQLDLAALYDQTRQASPEVLVPGAPLPTAEGAEGREPALPPEEEIAELKKKLSRLGSVNLEAIQELNELEMRAHTLQVQYDDLLAGQQTLQDIIQRINTDSRKLFVDTFTAVRTHFQELFRKLFGGGQADVVLEDENDVLECGIEIVARPPGKELRSISLMSGGEKTLTAVALLLAVFRSKPSPFCILDEVDAALDEANIGRFTVVLREFLDLSQFILITHSKRTMACADVLYGVTMAESGVSRRISVKFEDWPDDEKQPDSEPAGESSGEPAA
jgi:chromosome segregation protein